MPSAKAVQESEKNKRTKQAQDALTGDDKQKTEDKKIEETKATQETKTKEQTDNIDNNKQNVSAGALDTTLAKNN